MSPVTIPSPVGNRMVARRDTLRRSALSLAVLLSLAILRMATFPFAAEAAEPKRATVDTLTVEEVLKRQNARLDSLLYPESRMFDTLGIDGLLRAIDENGYEYLRTIDEKARRRPPLRFGLRPLALSTHNRVEGLRLGSGFGVSGRHARLDGAAAYGFSNHRWVGEGGLTLGRRSQGPAVRVEGQDRVVPFGPNARLSGYGLQALVAGQDRYDYLRRRGGAVRLWPWRATDGEASVAAFHHEELPVPAATDFSFFGNRRSPIERPNPTVDRGRVRGVSVAGEKSFKLDLIRAGLEAGVAGGGLGGDFDYSWQEGRVQLRPVFPDGGVLNLEVRGRNIGGTQPVQAGAFLGGEASLRGYSHLEFVGRRSASARVEYELGVDLLGRTGVSFLKPLKLQFIPFTDLGTTWGDTRGVETTRGNLDGSIRNSVGIGIRRDIWIPGAEAIRLDIIRRTDGSDEPWSAWFRLVSFAG